jgi:hypothetical protein
MAHFPFCLGDDSLIRSGGAFKPCGLRLAERVRAGLALSQQTVIAA